MDRRDAKKWREKVSVGTVRIAKSAWVWNDGLPCGLERLRDHERSRGEEKLWDKKRVIYGRSRGEEERAKRDDWRGGRERKDRGEERPPDEDRSWGEERARGAERPQDQERSPKEKKAGVERLASAGEKPPPGWEKGSEGKGRVEPQAQESQVAQDPRTESRSQDQERGPERKGSEDLHHDKTGVPSQDQERVQERKRTEDPTAIKTSGASQGKGRKGSENRILRKAQGPSQGKGRDQERKGSRGSTTRKAQGPSQGEKRDQERKGSRGSTTRKAQGPSQGEKRDQERKGSRGSTSRKTQGPSQGEKRDQERKGSRGSTSRKAQGPSQGEKRDQERKGSRGSTSRKAQGPSQGEKRDQERKGSGGSTSRKTQGPSQGEKRDQERKGSGGSTSRKTQGPSQGEKRDQERKGSGGSTSRKTQGPSQGEKRDQERKGSGGSTSRKTQGPSQGEKRDQERKGSGGSTSRKTQGLSQGRGHSVDGGAGEESPRNKTRGRLLSGATAKRKGTRDEGQREGGAAREEEGPRATDKSVVAEGRTAMSPVSPVWPRKPNLWAFWVLLLVLPRSLDSVRVDPIQQCNWLAVLSKFETVGTHFYKDRFIDHEPIDLQTEVFEKLGDSPIDPKEKYMTFPYYLQINFTCAGKDSEEMARNGHLLGMRPKLLVSYKCPVNFYKWEIENVQIQLDAAPMRSRGYCSSEAMCILNWYTPLPFKNGSAVITVDIHSNGLGPYVPQKRFYVNMNGFLKREASGKVIYRLGYENFMMKSDSLRRSKSRPLWFTKDQAPVLILGGIETEKAILITDTNFHDTDIVELSIDSCWVGSYYCPMLGFSATIFDAISTESTLFIRQNQLVYYFTGRYPTLYDTDQSSSSWVRVLPSECIKKLCPVYMSGNGSEYVLALNTGQNEGYIHIGTITDGSVSFQMVPNGLSICDRLPGTNCSIDWALYIDDERNLIVLVKTLNSSLHVVFYLLNYNLVNNTLETLYVLPPFIPEAQGLDFLVLLGTETYTNTPIDPKGMFFNTYNNILYIWGNFILQSYTRKHFIYLADFPRQSTIKYAVNSYQGQMVFVTEAEEIWYFQEGGYDVYRLIPSTGWDSYVYLQKMEQSLYFGDEEVLISVFFEDGQLFQLLYLTKDGTSQVIRRPVPVGRLLVYQQPKPYTIQRKGKHKTLSFTNFCPFKMMRLRDLPQKQHFARLEIYHASLPEVPDPLAFHTNVTLAVYQGLVYYLLWLHSKYDKPYADPVHDPTWRWWQHKTQYKDYYFYLSSNWLSLEGVYIDMDSYEKVYNTSDDDRGLPPEIYLDKGTSFSFTVFLSSHDDTSSSSAAGLGSIFQAEKKLAVAVIVADPECLKASVSHEVLLNRKAVLYKVTITDRKVCYGQGLSGYNLKKTSMVVKVLGSSGKCFQNTYLGTNMQGYLMVPVLIGCPAGKRLAFDVTYTILHSQEINKHYFDCVKANPEMPCFLFRDLFQPFFLVQDMVTGDSGSFLGSYLLKVVGGGHTIDTIRDYTEEEIYRYNSPLDNTNSLIWKTEDQRTTKDKKFYIMSYQSPGMEWLCLENSPCHDVTPRNIYAPEFFLKLLVSNRGVDTSTYCDYQLIFILHLHGLPLSSKRSLFIVIVSISLLLGLVVLYILFCLLWPHIVKAWVSLRWKINNLMASESYYTYASSNAALSVHSQTGLEGAPKEDNADAMKAEVA
ncbi:cation channel sperm-associated auxiliary subunit gamma [Acomys russatus]|uniref:cation channel sperm-associated auxiliary subunit gamma n=1 Tax=Acomys russatus TaxID=60746 RepID=UPI0021E2BB1A|nr:cation channel sperm-associated auxiliary subunit gamma [Acomys russatus]